MILDITNTKDQCFSLQFTYYIQLNPFIEKPEGNEIRKIYGYWKNEINASKLLMLAHICNLYMLRAQLNQIRQDRHPNYISVLN